MPHSSTDSHGNTVFVALCRNREVWLQNIEVMCCRIESDVVLWISWIELISNSLNNPYVIFHFWFVWFCFLGFFSKKLQTHLKADIVVLSSLAANVLEKAFKIVSTIFYYFDPESFIFGIILTILIFFFLPTVSKTRTKKDNKIKQKKKHSKKSETKQCDSSWLFFHFWSCFLYFLHCVLTQDRQNF